MLNTDHQYNRKDILYVVTGGDYPGDFHVLGVFNNKGVACKFARELMDRYRGYTRIDAAELNGKFETCVEVEAHPIYSKNGELSYEWKEGE